MVKYTKNVKLTAETTRLLNQARAKIIIEQNKNAASDDLVILTTLKEYMSNND